MAKTVSLTPSHRTKQYLVAVGVVGFFLVPLLGGLLSLAGLPTGEALGLAAAAGLVLAVAWVWRLSGEESDDTWAGIPEWQYDGRFAEAGGLTRSEQEESLDELTDQE
jgi:hypothetical protein